MRVVLIDPPFYRFIGFYNRYFPLGVVSVGTALKEAGHDVAVYDADYNDHPTALDYTRLIDHYGTYLESFADDHHPVWTEVRETLARLKPDLIGIAIWTTYAASAFHVARICKQVRPDCPVMMGGPHATVKADEVLRICPHVDYVIRGEGEQASIELLEHLAGARPDRASIHGLSYRREGTIQHAPAREKHRVLDTCPFPDRDLLMNAKTYTPEDMGLIMTSRGCPYACTYCATEIRRTCFRSVEHVLDEIRRTQERYGTIQFNFKDDSFTANKGRVEQLCDRIVAERLRIRWECTTRANLITGELLKTMKQAGCNSIKIGIESGSQTILEQMNKAITLEQLRQAAQWLRKAGIHWTGYFMMGVPGETEAHIYQTLKFMYELKPDYAHIGTYEPFPGTAMFDDGVQRGLLKPDMTLEEFYTTLPNDYYKAPGRRQVDTMDQDQFQALESEMKAKFHAYNNHVVRLFKRAWSRSRLYLSHPADLLADFKKYRSWS